MNDRIQELKRQASIWCDQNIPGEFNEITGGYGYHWEEKFVELIVRECIAQIGEFTGEQNVEPVVLADGTRGYDYDIVSAEEVLRKYFGIEE